MAGSGLTGWGIAMIWEPLYMQSYDVIHITIPPSHFPLHLSFSYPISKTPTAETNVIKNMSSSFLSLSLSHFYDHHMRDPSVITDPLGPDHLQIKRAQLVIDWDLCVKEIDLLQ